MGAFVLLIATVKVAFLLLARATLRQKEVAIRAAVSAERSRVLRQLLAESALQAVAGGAAGLLLARWAIFVLVRISPNAAPRLSEIDIDARVLAFTLAVSLLAGLLFGAAPAMALRRSKLHDSLKSGMRNSAGLGGLRLRRALAGVELALAIVLLTGAGLMLKSYARMNAHPPGFDPENITVMKVRFVQREADKPAQPVFPVGSSAADCPFRSASTRSRRVISRRWACGSKKGAGSPRPIPAASCSTGAWPGRCSAKSILSAASLLFHAP